MSGLQPRYENICSSNSCVLVGQLNEYDVYFCNTQYSPGRAKLIIRYKGSYELDRRVLEVTLRKEEGRWVTKISSTLAGSLSVESRAQLVRQATEQFINRESVDQNKFDGALERLEA